VRLLWLPSVLRDAGLNVVEMGGWENRGKELADVTLVVCHHTATGPRVSDEAVARLLREGRSDLAGPLAQLGLRRDGTFDLICAGKANHNGYGVGRNQTIGIEAYNDGMGEPWPRAQIDAYQRGCAAICAHLGWNATRVQGHKETDPKRKIDPAGIDMDGFRLGVTALLNDQPLDPPTQEDPLMALSDAEAKELLEKVRATDLRVAELQKEVVGEKDTKGNSRMDRLADIITRLGKKP
jgi:hypothetical protein